ncbi:hypothetical protein K469DRAFT_606274, partial [Zopfia rhizophila CBS 207.26]
KSFLIERMLKSFYYTKIIKYNSIINPVRLRIVRIFLYYYYKQKCINLKKDSDLLSCLFQSKGITSIAKNTILEKIYSYYNKNLSLEVRKRHENSLK